MIVLKTRTNNIFKAELHKWIAKRILGKQGGPISVLRSLIRGLDALKIEYKVNPLFNVGETIVVLSGSEALKDAIKLKKSGKIKKLIAGPNIFFSPLDENSLICDDEVDIVLVPSPWTSDLWASIAPNIKDKLRVWPAGVEIKESSTRLGLPIIYNKLKNIEIVKNIEMHLKNKGLMPQVFNYGSFKQSDFFESLKTAPFMIYLSDSESQGLAIQEAWAHDVPTFILRSNGFSAKGIEWEDPKINAPYLNDELGFFFENIKEIDTLIDKASEVHPIKYCKENLSDVACAKKLLELI